MSPSGTAQNGGAAEPLPADGASGPAPEDEQSPPAGGAIKPMPADDQSMPAYFEAFNDVNLAIPNGSPLGMSYSGLVSDIPAGMTVAGLTVTLDITGGYNGILYAYLVAPNGMMVTLMNQPGVSPENPFGASGSGMDITLQDGASDHGSIQNETSGSVLSGSYNAAGDLAGFNGSLADGSWTLFFADEASGGGQSTVVNWGLSISTVPEPQMWLLAGLGGALAWLSRRWRRS
jgi:subtilisin-like proprotein convertase family protein